MNGCSCALWVALAIQFVPLGTTVSAEDLHAAIPPELLTVAEQSDFRATARHADVIVLLDRLAARSPLAWRTSLGKSTEGRDIPVLVISNPPTRSPEEARREVAQNGKLIVFALGNIHAGEVDGKEALPMLARELLLTPDHPLLKDLIVIIAPNYNPDGNERVAKDNRPGQIGPEEGMGCRENATGLDLNRDYVKVEAPETRGLVGFLNEWDPHIYIDTHTTNGCYHRYVITYEGPKVPAGNADLIRFCRERFFPAVSELLAAKYGVPSFWYGDFDRTHQRWETYPAQARYGTSYVGLRGRISVLSEGYSYAPYKTRVLGTRDFVKSICEYAAANKDPIRKLLIDGDAATTAAGQNPRPADQVALRTRPIAGPAKVMARGFEETRDSAGKVTLGNPKDYEVELWTHFEPTLTVQRPFAYALHPHLTAVVDKLREHGIAVQKIAAPIEVAAEEYTIDAVEHAAQPFQGHKLTTVSATARPITSRLDPGWFLVRTAQPLGSLAVYLLEPQCEDGLTTWNYLDDWLQAGKTYPILRIPRPADLPTTADLP